MTTQTALPNDHMESDNIIELETEIEELEPKTAPSGTDIVLPPIIVGHGHGKGK